MTQNRNLEAMIHDITDYMFLSKSDMLEMKSIGEIATIKAGGDCPMIFSKCPTDELTIPIYSNGTENEGLYGYTNQRGISGRSITVAARGTIGFCYRRVGEYVPIIRLLAVSPHFEGGDIYLHQIINRMTFKKNGSVQQQLTVPELAMVKIPYPTSSQLKQYDNIVFPMVKQIEHKKKENLTLKIQRDSLLPLLMNGQVSVTQLNSDFVASPIFYRRTKKD